MFVVKVACLWCQYNPCYYSCCYCYDTSIVNNSFTTARFGIALHFYIAKRCNKSTCSTIVAFCF